MDCLNAYYFDRHRECFEAILYYYQSSGTLFRPSHIPMTVFVQEVRFFGISEDVIANLHKLEGGWNKGVNLKVVWDLGFPLLCKTSVTSILVP